MGRRYQDSIAFKRKLSNIEHKLNMVGYQTEPNERECWLGVTRRKHQAKLTYEFIMRESIGDAVTQVKKRLVQKHLASVESRYRS